MNEKPIYMIWIEFFCFVAVGALAATGDKIGGGAEWAELARPGIIIAMMLGGANAALSFFSRSGDQIRPKTQK